MKIKYLVIALLLILLGFTVLKLMEYEDQVRKRRIVKEYVEDETRPLISKLSPAELEKAASEAVVSFRSDGDYFSHLRYNYKDDSSRWETMLVKAINLGVALPGKYPTEYSMSYEHYLEWFILIGRMNANSVRVYTILPPAFYDALAYYNVTHDDKPLYLIQGVWAGMPDDNDYFNKAFMREVREDIRDVLDVLHGNAVLPEKRGKAHGIYTSDVSPYVSAILFGHEWEPNSVFVTNDKNGLTRYTGDFISVNYGNPTEVWLAEMMDFIVLYETQVYGMQHPVSFVNWLPLDPMFHNTETIERNHTKRFDNDLESLDYMRFHCTPLFRPGIFAAYHAYPYYPDFIHQERKYRTNLNEEGIVDNYRAYLLDLKGRTPGMPLLIAEYGVPSSRGNSHSSEFGFDQGGYSEKEHALKNMQLTKTIFESGCAGAAFFEWIDEWFKHNWLVMNYEIPDNERKNWHNLENPEQNYGIMALENKQRIVDGSLSDWVGYKFDRRENTCAFHADPAYFYIALQLKDFKLEQNNLYIAVDVKDPQRGSYRLPFTDELQETGYEFLIEIHGKNKARILTDRHYMAFPIKKKGQISNYAPVENNDGVFVEEILIPNDSRISLDGVRFGDIYYNRNVLVHGKTADPATSNADWFFDPVAGVLELRLTWPMLNVTSPGSRSVLDDNPDTEELEFSETEGFFIQAFITDKQDRVLTQIPKTAPSFFTWDKWGDNPVYRERLKPVYYTLGDYFRDLKHAPAYVGTVESQEIRAVICPFYGDKPAAVSISMENGALSQVELVPPVMKKYRYIATFGIDSRNMESPDYFSVKDITGMFPRMGLNQLLALADSGHYFARQPSTVRVEDLLPDSISTPKVSDKILSYIVKAGEEGTAYPIGSFVRNPAGDEPWAGKWQNVDFQVLPSASLSGAEISAALAENKDQWTILSYMTIAPEDSTKHYPGAEQKHITPVEEFERHVRIARNSDAWIAPEAEVYKYIREYRHSSLSITMRDDILFVMVDHKLDKIAFNHPLTVKIPVSAPYISVSGSEHDGIYQNRTGVLMVNVFPGKEVTLKMIHP